MAVHAGQVTLHEQLLITLWGEQNRDDPEYLRANIRCLRQKIEADPAHPQRIVAVPGVGYMVNAPEVAKPSA